MYCWYIVCCFDNGMVIIVIGGFIFFREVDKCRVIYVFFVK